MIFSAERRRVFFGAAVVGTSRLVVREVVILRGMLMKGCERVGVNVVSDCEMIAMIAGGEKVVVSAAVVSSQAYRHGLMLVDLMSSATSASQPSPLGSHWHPSRHDGSVSAHVR